MLPRVKIDFENGLLGGFNSSADGLLGLVCTGVAVGETFALAKPYLIRRLQDLEDLGVTSTSTGNERLYKNVVEFYSEAVDGTPLWIIAFANTNSLSDLVDKDEQTAVLLLAAQSGVKGIAVDFQPASGYTPTVTDGLDADVYAALTKAQALANDRSSKFAPIFVILPGQQFSGTASALKDLKILTHNRVGVVLGDTTSDSNFACVGLVAGRIAKMPVQRHIGRVKDGALNYPIYIGDESADLADAETINDLGFITFRSFVGKAGQFIADDSLATAASDDYRSLARRRTVDKAYRIAYTTLVNELNDEIPVTNAGTLTPGYAKHIEKLVEDAIVDQMTALNNLGADPEDPNDKGVICYVNYNQDILSAGSFDVSLKVKPYGYGKYIDVKLGFLTTTE